MLARWTLWWLLRNLQRAGNLIRLSTSDENDAYICELLRVGFTWVYFKAWGTSNGKLVPWGEVYLRMQDIRLVEPFNRFLQRDLLLQNPGAHQDQGDLVDPD